MRRRALPALLLLGALSLAAAGCGGQATVSARPPAAAPKAQGVTLTDDAGRTVTLGAPAERIVSLGPSDTEIALALGLRKEIAGADHASFQYMPKTYQKELAGAADVGNAASTPDIEKIRALAPDLVLAVYDAPYVKKLTSLGIPVAILDPSTVQGIAKDILLLGKATGRERAATRVAAGIEGRIKALAQAAKGAKGSPSVFVELGPSLYTAGPGSYIDQLVKLAGGVNTADTMAKVAYPQVTSEQVIAADPEVIVLQDQGSGVDPAKVAARPGWGVIRAVKDHRVVTSVDPSLLSEPGPSVTAGLRELVLALHPGIVLPKTSG